MNMNNSRLYIFIMLHHKLMFIPQPPPFRFLCLLWLLTASQKVNLFPSVIKHHAMMAYEKVEVLLHYFLTSEFDTGIDIGKKRQA